jgi:hypothetical protein
MGSQRPSREPVARLAHDRSAHAVRDQAPSRLPTVIWSRYDGSGAAPCGRLNVPGMLPVSAIRIPKIAMEWLADR